MPKGTKVLMVDDDKMLREMYQERLELAGYPTITSENGEDALKKVREINPDIILLDVVMPHLNGYETLATLKSDPETKDIPVIMLTALYRDFNRGKAVSIGAADYIVKSEATPKEILQTIDEVLKKAKES